VAEPTGGEAEPGVDPEDERRSDEARSRPGGWAEEELARDGYRHIRAAPTTDADFDRQGHLNNAATVRVFNDARVAYVHEEIGSWWLELIAEAGYVIAARELHVLYESEGLPGEMFVAAMRYVRSEGKALVLEQRLVEASTARPIARAWVVQLLVQDGRVVDWPERYLDRVATIEGTPLRARPRATARSWGPPE
jgi:acyl-CoA thioesterase FadM